MVGFHGLSGLKDARRDVFVFTSLRHTSPISMFLDFLRTLSTGEDVQLPRLREMYDLVLLHGCPASQLQLCDEALREKCMVRPGEWKAMESRRSKITPENPERGSIGRHWLPRPSKLSFRPFFWFQERD